MASNYAMGGPAKNPTCQPLIIRPQNVIQRLLVGDLGADVIGALKSRLASL